MQRPGGIGRDEFHQHRATGTDAAESVLLAGLTNVIYDRAASLGRQKKIDEAGTGDFGFFQQPRSRQRGDQLLGQRPRVTPDRFRQHHRQVGCEIAVPGIARALDMNRSFLNLGLNLRLRALLQHALPTQLVHRLREQVLKMLLHGEIFLTK